jgi:guanine deaminase
MPMNHTQFLELAVQDAVASVAAGGGPFAAMIVRDEVVLSRGTNRVTLDVDPTAHAEIVAIRAATRVVQCHMLRGCTLYCSCEPCPMCLGAILWARLDAVYYAADRHDAAAAEFDDARFYAALSGGGDQGTPRRRHIELESRRAPFLAWSANPHRIPY